MNWHKQAIRILSFLFYLMLVGAAYSHLVNKKAPLNGFASAVFLFVAGALVLFNSAPQDRMRLCLAAFLGFVAEVVGVRYGWLFGKYYYTEILAPNCFGVPLAMSCAWLLLIGYVQHMVVSFKLSRVFTIIAIGGWMTVIDLLIDPLAAHQFGYWIWRESGIYYEIPFRNFVGWFVVSTFVALVDSFLFRRSFHVRRPIQNSGLGILVLYTVCAIAYHLWLAAMVGGGLICWHWLLIFPAKSGKNNK